MNFRHPHSKIIDIAGKEQDVCSCNSPFPSYICPSCHTIFCRDCAKLVGIPASCICRICDSLCSDYNEFLRKQSILADKATPFGVEDFKAALSFPFQEFSTNSGLALIYGALLFATPYLGLSGVGMFFGIGGVIPALIGNGLMLNCNVRVIQACEAGRSERKHLLDASEMLADLGETVALSCGIIFITLAPYLLGLLFTRSAPFLQWLGFGWMVFYYPLALRIAAATNNFWEIINPLRGLEVIQTHKSAYPKFFFFYLLIPAVVGGSVLTTLVKSLQSVSGSPLIALLPLFIVLMTVLGSLVFYGNLVIAYLIGRMEFKGP
jgi:hypothetical protein